MSIDSPRGAFSKVESSDGAPRGFCRNSLALRISFKGFLY